MRRTLALCLALSLSVMVAGCTPSQISAWLRGEAQGEGPAYVHDTDAEGVERPVLPLNPTYDELKTSRHTWSQTGDDFDVDVWMGMGDATMTYASTMHDVKPEIYVKTVNGRAVTRLTHNPAIDIHPHFSPDGRQVAFASDRNGNFDIFVTDSQRGGACWQITSSPQDDIYPSWSPDGRWLCYSSRSVTGEWEIWMRETGTEQSINLGPGLYPEWSPSGEKLAFQRASNRGPFWYSLWVIDVQGSQVSEVVSSDDYAAINPSWSPDGEWICFTSVHKSNIARQEGRYYNGDDIWVVKPDGSDRAQVAFNPRPDWNPSWGADGRIYFCSDRERSRSIWSVQPMLRPMTTTAEAR